MMESIFLLLALLLPQLGTPSGQPIAWTDTIAIDAGRTQVIYRHTSQLEYSQFRADGKLDYRALPTYRDGKLVVETRYYPRITDSQIYLIERELHPTYNDLGQLDYMLVDAFTVHPELEPNLIAGWRFFARGNGIETETAFDSDGNWQESILRTLDDKGRCARQLSLTSTGAIAQDIRFTRDEADRVTSFVYGGSTYTIKYVMDSHNNWTLATITPAPPITPVTSAPGAAPMPPLIAMPAFYIQRKIIYPD
ncbi:hypothetical protein M0R72_15675 [Candidatus Pacearchaeota archaeon]|nr:hypothetical protein [Candidatus Pacearchaeota archaeon]